MVDRVIYDLGANEGMNLPYFLLKADRVIAVEANSALTQTISRRFEREISSGRLVIENAAVTTDESAGFVPFYLHRSSSVLSQFPEPSEERLNEFDRVMVPSITLEELFARHGDPYYLKLDLESFDGKVLRRLFQIGVRPDYISAEAHSREIFDLLAAEGRYPAYKLVNGPTVHIRFRRARIKLVQGSRWYRFPEHSSGPFGDDIPGPWFSVTAFDELLSMEEFGWKDIHATTTSTMPVAGHPSHVRFVIRSFGRRAIALAGHLRVLVTAERGGRDAHRRGVDA